MTFSLQEQRAKLQAALGPTMQVLPEPSPTAQPRLILDQRDGKLWDNVEEYTRSVTDFYANQSRQLRSARKYAIAEDDHELGPLEHMSYADALRLLRTCELELEEAFGPPAVFCVEDEGLFVAREQTVPHYFQNMIDWVPPAAEEDVEDDGGLLRVCGGESDPASSAEDLKATAGAVRFSINAEALMGLDPSDRAVISDLVKTVGLAQQRRVALERNRLKLHVLIEDGRRSIDLYTAYVNAIKVYDHLLRIQQLDAEKEDLEQIRAIDNYRQIILNACLLNLKARRFAVFNVTKILDQSRVWIEDLLERAVKTERQVQQTAEELLRGPFPLLNVAPPNISQWMLEAEQVAHTCANISYLITTKLELNPRKLNDLRKDQHEKTWLLGIPKFETFVFDSDEEEEDSSPGESSAT